MSGSISAISIPSADIALLLNVNVRNSLIPPLGVLRLRMIGPVEIESFVLFAHFTLNMSSKNVANAHGISSPTLFAKDISAKTTRRVML